MPGLADLGEFGFIDLIAQMAGPAPRQVLKSIGDDCAVLDLGGPRKLLVGTDAAMEGRHFQLEWMSPYEVGQRTVAGALSDIAAMGGVPLACLCTCAIPPDTPVQVATDLMRGVAETGRRYGAPLIGGDTIAATGALLLDVTVLGETDRPWLRSGAKPGDRLLLTGCLGEAATALLLLEQNPDLLREERFAPLLKRAVDPTPRLQEAALLAGTGRIHAAVDISDGLYQDAGHIARQSHVRLEIEVARLPVASAPELPVKRPASEVPWWAATSGEEYELLLAVDRDSVPFVTGLLSNAGLAPITPIGTVVQGEGVVLVRHDGSEIEIERGGWDHFKLPAT